MNDKELMAFSDDELKERLVEIGNAIDAFEFEIRDFKNEQNKIIFELNRRYEQHE